MSWTLKKSGELGILAFNGGISSDSAHEIKRVLMKYISVHDLPIFDFAEVTEVDSSFIKVFYTACRISEKLGKRPVLLGLEKAEGLVDLRRCEDFD